jgi:hypothetical protein
MRNLRHCPDQVRTLGSKAEKRQIGAPKSRTAAVCGVSLLSGFQRCRLSMGGRASGVTKCARTARRLPSENIGYQQQSAILQRPANFLSGGSVLFARLAMLPLAQRKGYATGDL